MKKIVVLGGGRQGRVIASDLSRHAQVSVADVRPLELAGTTWLEADLAKPETLVRIIREHDLAVGALPSRLGYGAAHAAVEARRPYVDIAFFAEDPVLLHREALRAGVPVMLDCGLAPGLSNLLVGRALARGNPEEIHIQVGGVAADPRRPYGYVVTWSLEDLLEEYTRPARIVRGGAAVAVPVFSELVRIEVEGVGEMESFLTDGLRSLLECGVREMTEKTLRWPGHVEAVRPLLASGRFVEELRSRCADGDDLVVLLIDVVRKGKRERLTMLDRARSGLSAMSRTTALTCAAFARWVAEGGVDQVGLLPPEKIGFDERAVRFILDALAAHGMRISA